VERGTGWEAPPEPSGDWWLKDPSEWAEDPPEMSIQGRRATRAERERVVARELERRTAMGRTSKRVSWLRWLLRWGGR
jgi:hypothetical protein